MTDTVPYIEPSSSPSKVPTETPTETPTPKPTPTVTCGLPTLATAETPTPKPNPPPSCGERGSRCFDNIPSSSPSSSENNSSSSLKPSTSPSKVPTETSTPTPEPTPRPTFCRRSGSRCGDIPPGAPTAVGFHLCFSSINTIETKEDGIISISKLKIGDFVKTTGINKYTQVYGFGHYDPNRKETYIQIHFDNQDNQDYDNEYDVSKTLEISDKHLLFVDRINKLYPIRASDVIVGDILSGKNVTSIRNTIRRGVYAPLTMSGDIIISGIRSSNYVDILNYNNGWYDQHVIGHAYFAPKRIFCTYFMDTCKEERYINGYGEWSYMLVNSASKLNNLGWLANVSFAYYSIIAVNFMSLFELQPMFSCFVIFYLSYKIIKKVTIRRTRKST